MLAIVIGAALCAAAIAGCGGGDGDETSSLTKAQYVKQADAICTKAGEEKEKAIAAAFKKRSLDKLPSSKKVQEELVLDVLPPLKKMTEELAELEAPSGDEERVEAMVQSFEDSVENLEEDPGEGLKENYNAFDKPTKLAADYGLETCSNVS